MQQLLQQTAVVVIQQPVVWVIFLSQFRKLFQPFPKSPPHHFSSQARSLIKHWLSITDRAELMKLIKKLFPPRIPRRYRIDRHHTPIIRIRQKRFLVLRYAIPHAEHIRAISLFLIVLFTELEKIR